MQLTLRRLFVGSVASLVLVACSHEPLDEAPPPPPGELGNGPGIVSGAEGGFYITGGPPKRKKYGQ